MKSLKTIVNNCDSENSIIFPGEGIEKIYEEIQKKFSKSRSIFISSDTVKKKNLNSFLKKIINNDVNIIIGTQILSKGHNFPFLKTVGILNIDHFLMILISDPLKNVFNKSFKFPEEPVEKIKKEMF